MIAAARLGCAGDPATGNLRLSIVDEQAEPRHGAEMDVELADNWVGCTRAR